MVKTTRLAAENNPYSRGNFFQCTTNKMLNKTSAARFKISIYPADPLKMYRAEWIRLSHGGTIRACKLVSVNGMIDGSPPLARINRYTPIATKGPKPAKNRSTNLVFLKRVCKSPHANGNRSA